MGGSLCAGVSHGPWLVLLRFLDRGPNHQVSYGNQPQDFIGKRVCNMSRPIVLVPAAIARRGQVLTSVPLGAQADSGVQ